MFSTTYLTAFFLLLNLSTSQILSPKKGSHIQPGAIFPFNYEIHSDYCESSYNFTVFLFTDKPTTLSPSLSWAHGHYFGRFSEDNYPGNPFPTNLPPTTLTMPDFSSFQGGFGEGMNASNKKVWLTVLEETQGCTGTLGVNLILEAVELVYNATGGPS